MPDETPTANLATVLFMCDGQQAEARALCEGGLVRSPRNAALLDLLGMLEVNAGRAKEAIPYFEQAFAIQPTAEFRLNEWGARQSCGEVVPEEDVLAAMQQFPQQHGLLLLRGNQLIDRFQSTRDPVALLNAEQALTSALADQLPAMRPTTSSEM